MEDVVMPEQADDGQLAYQAEVEIALASLRRGANWFYWLAALSLINSIIVLVGGNTQFLFGLGVTQFVDGFGLAFIQEAPESATVISAVTFCISAAIAGVVVVFGVLANRVKEWAFVVGMVLYVLDALLLVLIEHWLAVAFHAWVLFALFGGLKACKALKALYQQAAPPQSAG